MTYDRTRLKHWHNDLGSGSEQWAWEVKFGRVQCKLFVYRHQSRMVGERWVFQPGLTYDRKPRPKYTSTATTAARTFWSSNDPAIARSMREMKRTDREK